MTKKTTHARSKETEIELIKHTLDSIDNKLNDIHKHIIGNGRAGLLERVSNLETGVKVTYIMLTVLIAFAGVMVVVLK